MYQYPYQPPYQPKPLAGRAVNAIGEIAVSDIPNDGTAAYFPALDGSCIWAKQWRSDGSIDTLRYVLEPPPPPEPDRIDVIMQRLDAIEAALKPKRKKGDDE